jgi:transposase
MGNHQTDVANKARGVPRVDDRRVLNGIFWVLRSGAPWRDLPSTFGPYTTCYNRFVRWRRAGVWSRIMDALATAHDAAVQMIDTSIVRVHQHGACGFRNKRQSMGRSRGGLTSKIQSPARWIFPEQRSDDRSLHNRQRRTRHPLRFRRRMGREMRHE